MCFFLSFIPATAWVVIGYFVLFSSTKAEGGVQKQGQILAIWIFFMRQMQGAGGRAMGFGKSKAKLLTEQQGRVTFEDVAGVDEAKEDLQEIVEFLRDPQKYQRLGGRMPRGVSLV